MAPDYNISLIRDREKEVKRQTDRDRETKGLTQAEIFIEIN